MNRSVTLTAALFLGLLLSGPSVGQGTTTAELLADLNVIEHELRAIDRTLIAMGEVVMPLEDGTGPGFRGAMWQAFMTLAGKDLDTFLQENGTRDNYPGQLLLEEWKRVEAGSLVIQETVATEEAAPATSVATTANAGAGGPRFCAIYGRVSRGNGAVSKASKPTRSDLSASGAEINLARFEESIGTADQQYAAIRTAQRHAIEQMVEWHDAATAAIDEYSMPMINEMDDVKAARDEVYSLLQGKRVVDESGEVVEGAAPVSPIDALVLEATAEIEEIVSGLRDRLEIERQELERTAARSVLPAQAQESMSAAQSAASCILNLTGYWVQTNEPRKLGLRLCGSALVLQHEGTDGQSAITQIRGIFRQSAPRLSRKTEEERAMIADAIKARRGFGARDASGRCHPPLYSLVTGKIEGRSVELGFSREQEPLKVVAEGDAGARIFLVEVDQHAGAGGALVSYTTHGRLVCEWTVPTLGKDATEQDKLVAEQVVKFRKAYGCKE